MSGSKKREGEVSRDIRRKQRKGRREGHGR